VAGEEEDPDIKGFCGTLLASRPRRMNPQITLGMIADPRGGADGDGFKLGWPTGLAPVRTPSQGVMLQLHHGQHS
ncbi:MAG TPA: hypothetical protein VK961_09285, partial [Chthoniobacter sp.]|nr:hypothetical protein [Chthoniobacter sp.]